MQFRPPLYTAAEPLQIFFSRKYDLKVGELNPCAHYVRINFPKNSKKNKNFLNMLKTKYKEEVKRNKVGGTKDLILENITANPKTIKELCSILGFSKEMIYKHIKELKCQDKIYFEYGLIRLKR